MEVGGEEAEGSLMTLPECLGAATPEATSPEHEAQTPFILSEGCGIAGAPCQLTLRGQAQFQAPGIRLRSGASSHNQAECQCTLASLGTWPCRPARSHQLTCEPRKSLGNSGSREADRVQEAFAGAHLKCLEGSD